MWISLFKSNHKLKFVLPIIFSFLLVLVSIFSFIQASTNSVIEWNNKNANSVNPEASEEKKYIKWFEFNVSYEVLDKTSKLDIASHTKNEEVKLNWIELISYLACKYGNDFSKFKQKDLDNLVAKLKSGQTISDMTQDMKYYSYYLEGYDSVLHEFIGEYQVETKNSTSNKSQNSQNSNVAFATNEVNSENAVMKQQMASEKQFAEKYGIKAFSPIAKNYFYNHYDDFGTSRSYGYKRLHFGNDLMGSIGSPIIAVESGIVEALRLESIWRLENRNS